jgi:hypothetical protein
LPPCKSIPKVRARMKLQVKQASGSGELTVQSQKEFLQLLQRGVIASDDLVLRGESWVPIGTLPWIRGMHVERRKDNKRLLYITLAMMLLGLAGVLWIEKHASLVAQKSGALPPGAVHAVSH